MQITVVIPSYNRRHTLERALDSVYAQTSPVDEVILVDDGSSDGSAAMVAHRYPQVRIIRQPNLGVSAARNRGIDAAVYDWIALLDSDDSWLPKKIAAIRAAHAKKPGYVLYHSDEIWVRRGVRVNPMKKHRKSGGRIFDYCLPMCRISPSSVVIHRDLFAALGGFDESLPACEDYDLWLRLCQRYPVHYLDQALIVKYGGHQDQLSRQHPMMDRFRVHSLHRLLTRGGLSAQQRDAAASMLRHKLQILLKGAHKHRNRQLLEELAPLSECWRTTAESPVAC